MRPPYSGLFIHEMDDASLVQTVENAMQGGASGVSLFSAGGMTEERWKTFRKVRLGKE